ncbi:MAG: hypothetical protein J6U38_03275 [Clostridia bacterium]|nr:hypothetical protein [Clostridia bacterium]MBO7503367.1 hypothetical protein [Clostridia bacterium]MBO7657733.1 hypothetical protein [Clostridia bacterium]MBP5665141.1 hypothetical protein [Clostridia bacterium]MBP5765467.1 hypothetical protein [Clostridia bacterium]
MKNSGKTGKKEQTAQAQAPEVAPAPAFTAIELRERNKELNRSSSILLAFDAWKTRTGAMTSRVTYTRRYDLDAEFDSVSNFFSISETVVDRCRDFITEKLLNDFPAGRAAKKGDTFSEIRVFSGRKVVARVMKNEATGPIFEELSALLSRTLG